MNFLGRFVVIFALSAQVVLFAADEQNAAKLNDDALRAAPLTIIFRHFTGNVSADVPYSWYWSFNSAGQGELTIRSSVTEHRRVALSDGQMAAIRKALRDERFVELKDTYGRLYHHGGWSTLTVVAGEYVNKTVRYDSVWSWATDREKATLIEAASAARVWLTLTEIVDPDGKIFEERKALAVAIKALTK